MLKQILSVIKLLGLRRAAQLKHRHERGLPPLRGYMATRCFWTLLQCGFWDEFQHAENVRIDHFADQKCLNAETLEAICRYLDGIGWVKLRDKTLQLTKRGRILLAEPRGLYELGYGYSPVMQTLDDLLMGRLEVGRDVHRRTDWVSIGSGRLCRQLPYPMLGNLVAKYGGRHVLDLGCGDASLLIWLTQHLQGLQGVGIDLDETTAGLARRHIAEKGLADRIRVLCGDMFDLVRPDRQSAGPALAELDEPDTITACDTFHEYLWDSSQRIVYLLRGLKARWPNAIIVMADFCVPSRKWLRRHPTALLEHHLWHDLTQQRLISEADWRTIFGQAGLQVVDARLVNIIGHGYFVLR